ncbi:RNA polymerase sigma factor [uncultured Flavonifractor sp.]|uniref:RNA polymerase sigma factor n=1 Tax=uncultured Flavonifractor sp. TaxID=1193534 RepID=UPI002606A2E3|nr:sigma-70 family RNA polymerase sigma factor [uncultured Flavonifractor sp.]
MMHTAAQKEQIYMEYRDKVARYVAGKVGDIQEREDLVSSVFLKVFQNLDTFDRERASLSTWIYTITHNTVLNHYRGMRPVQELNEELADPSEGLEIHLLSEEMLERLARALEELDRRQRDLILLHYYENRTLKQIAALMQMSYANAKVIHQKALSRLRDQLA